MAVSGNATAPAAVVAPSRLKPLPQRRCATWWAIFMGTAATAGLPGIKGLPNVVLHLAFDPTGRRLAAVLGGGEGLRLYGLATGGAPAGAAVAWSEDGRDSDYGERAYWADFAADGRLVTSCFDGQVRLYAPALDGPDATPRRSVWGRIKSAFSGGGQGLKPTHRVRPPGGKRPFTVAFSPDGTRIAVGYDDSTAVDLLDGCPP